MSAETLSGRADLILVQHAHQHIVTAGYDNREGVFDLHRALSGMLLEHLARRVPLALHISGTLTTALMWHVPAFAGLVRRASEEGLLELIGSAYAQNVMPLFSAEHNLRQLGETLRLYQRHYGVHPENVTCAWVPERVWNTEILAGVFASPDLPNGGYRTVLLDDRHAYRTHADAGDVSRAEFDAESAPGAACLGEYAWRDRPLPGGDGRHLRPYRIAGAERLVVLPLSSELRYALPVHGPAQAERLERVLASAAATGRGTLLTFGDDAERSGGVGPWAPSPWHEQSLSPYAATMAVLTEDPRVRLRLPSEWLAHHDVTAVRPVDPGGFYELVTQQGAGEDYRGFWDAEEWRPYRAELQAVEELLCAPVPGTPSGGLWDAAWQQLMVSSYETGWQEPDDAGVYRPAPWAKATANHVREARLLAAAAARADRPERTVFVQVADLDGEGNEEIVLCNGAMFVVVSPRYGGRIVLACDLTIAGGRVVIGNFADDWNWQEQPHQFMGRPRNHPGGLADVGAENDRYAIVDLRVDDGGLLLVLGNVELGSRLHGLRKTFRLPVDANRLEVSYRLPEHCARVGVEFALCPDYLHLLREGREALTSLEGDGRARRGFAAGRTAVWVDVEGGQPVAWDRPVEPECGHAGILRLSAWGSFDLTLHACQVGAAHSAIGMSPWRAAAPLQGSAAALGTSLVADDEGDDLMSVAG